MTCPTGHAGQPSSRSDRSWPTRREAPAFAEVRRAVAADLADLPAGCAVLVAVSGGPDSLALAAAVAATAPAANVTAGAVTVDHRLQPGSDRLAADVAETCRRLGLSRVQVVTVDVPRSKDGPEAAARTVRYAALGAAADETGATAVLLGHTLDDQAETVLLGLARGSGARSLAGMPARRDRFRRPLLGLPRELTRETCDELGLTPWHDPHNFDPAYARARVRVQLLPELERGLGPGVAEALARSAALLRDDADALDAVAAEAMLDSDALSVSCLAARPAAVRRRMLRLVVLAAGVPTGSLTAEHLQRLDRLVTEPGHGPVRLPGRLEAAVRYDRLWLR